MSVTLHDIARETGLSTSTISKYINGVKLKERNRIAVEQAIEKLGYTVNEYARGLKSNRSRTIGVVIPELSNLFISNIISHMEESLRSAGYSIIVSDCHSDERLEAEAVQFLLRKMVDGIVNMPVCRDGRHLLPALEKDVPVVLIDRNIPELSERVNGVFIDNETAAYQATRRLIDEGHRRIGIIIGPSEVYTSHCRLSGYRKALEEAGIEPDEELIVYSDYTVQGGYTGVRHLVRTRENMTALFITNYEMTLGGIIAINELQIPVPQKLSVIGFDNMDLSRITHPKLSIVVQPLQDIGSEAAKLLLEQLSDEAGPSRTVQFPVSIHEGESVAPPFA